MIWQHHIFLALINFGEAEGIMGIEVCSFWFTLYIYEYNLGLIKPMRILYTATYIESLLLLSGSCIFELEEEKLDGGSVTIFLLKS